MSSKEQKTILLVEDDMIIAMNEKITLEKYRYRVITAKTGEEAVAAIETTPGIDLILMDINLGAGIDGTEAAEIILRERDLPVVFLSSHTEPAIVEKTEKITFYGYVVKNSSITVLDASIKMAFKLFEAKIKEKEKEKALLESETKYRTLVEKANEAILIVQDGLFVFANRKTSDLLGVPAGDLEGKPFIDFVWPEDRKLVIENYRKRIIGEIVRDAYDFRIIGMGGRLTWLFLSAATIQWKGKTATLNLLTDITERKQAEKTLRESEARLRHLMESSNDLVWETDANGAITYVSDKIMDLLGYTPEEVIGKTGYDLMPPEEAEKTRAAFGSLSTQRKALRSIENINLHKNGQQVVMESNGVPVFDENGAFRGYRGMDRDITERKQAEKTLRESEEKYRILFENANEAIFVVQDGKLVFCNPMTSQIMGYSSKEIKTKSFMEFVHPDDRDMAAERHSKRLRGEETPALYSLRIVDRDGNTRWAENNAVLIKWEGKAATLNFANDITARKQAEEALRASEERNLTMGGQRK